MESSLWTLEPTGVECCCGREPRSVYKQLSLHMVKEYRKYRPLIMGNGWKWNGWVGPFLTLERHVQLSIRWWKIRDLFIPFSLTIPKQVTNARSRIARYSCFHSDFSFIFLTPRNFLENSMKPHWKIAQTYFSDAFASPQPEECVLLQCWYLSLSKLLEDGSETFSTHADDANGAECGVV